MLLKLKLQYFGRLMQRADSFEKTLRLENGKEWYKVSEVDIPKGTRALPAPRSSLDFILYVMGRNRVFYIGRTESDLCHRPCWLQCGEGPLGQEVAAVAVA